MKDKKLLLITSFLSSVILVMELVLFAQMGIYVDEYATSPDILYGGYFFLLLAWLKLCSLFGLTIFLWIKTFQKD